MKDTLQPGIVHSFRFDITDRKTVPALYPESDEFQQMPEVFATGHRHASRDVGGSGG